MSTTRTFPSPLAGEGAVRRRRAAGEGAGSPTIARRLRARMTDAERKLWFALKDCRFERYKFRRQVPVGPYIADFLCFELRIVIEVDGGQHADSDRDERRDQWLACNGFHVLRFWNNEVLSNLDGVLTQLAHFVERTPHPTSLRSATLSRNGRGSLRKGLSGDQL